MLSSFLPIFFTMLIVVDPVGIVPIFMGLTSRIPHDKKAGIINKAVLVSFLVLLGFVFLGRFILELLHIEPGSFFIAGGIMLFIIALEMLFGFSSHSKVSEREQSPPDYQHSRPIAIFPLAIPMLAGPGSLTTIILYAGGYTKVGNEFNYTEVSIMLVIAIVLVLAIAALFLRGSVLVLKFLKQTGVSVMERIMGLLLAGLSVQFVYDGILHLGFKP